MTDFKKYKSFYRKERFSPNCTLEIFTDHELKMFHRFGYCLEALSHEDLKPINQEQEHFVLMVQGKVPPKTSLEKLWIKYQKRLKIDQGDKDTPHYEVKDAGESWLSRNDLKMGPY